MVINVTLRKYRIPRKMYIQVISDYKCRGQLGQIYGKCTLGYYDTLAFSLRKSESATWCMLAATHFLSQEGSSCPSMASIYESINRTRIRTSVNYNILLVYRNLPKHYRTAMICVFLPNSSLLLTRTPSPITQAS